VDDDFIFRAAKPGVLRWDYHTENFCRETKCPICGAAPVYFVRHNGGSVWFDDLGKPWPKHGCFARESVKDDRHEALLQRSAISSQALAFGIVLETEAIVRGEEWRIKVRCSDGSLVDGAFTTTLDLSRWLGEMVFVEHTPNSIFLHRLLEESAEAANGASTEIDRAGPLGPLPDGGSCLRWRHHERDYCRPKKCPQCQGRVFRVLYNGGSIWVDTLGWPWPKHKCFENTEATLNTRRRLSEAARAVGAPLIGLVVEVEAEPRGFRVILYCENRTYLTAGIAHLRNWRRLVGELLVVSRSTLGDRAGGVRLVHPLIPLQHQVVNVYAGVKSCDHLFNPWKRWFDSYVKKGRGA